MPISFDAGFFEPPVSADLVQGENAYDDSSNVSATLGATATADNLLIAAYFWSSADGTAPTAPSAPTGYTQLYSLETLGSIFSLFYKISDGTETAVTIGAEGALLFWEVTGVNTDLPITTAFATNSEDGSTTGIRAPDAGTVVVDRSDALVMSVYAYTDNDHAGSTVDYVGATDNEDFYMGIRGDTGSGAEDFHIFCAWGEVTDNTAQAVLFDPSNATAEDNFASIFVINLDPVEHPSGETLEFVPASISSDQSTNVTGEILQFVPGTLNEGTAPAENPLGEVLEFVAAPISSDQSTNVAPELLEFVTSPISSDQSTNVTGEILQFVGGTLNETAELTVANIVAGIMSHVIDGYTVEQILRLNLAVNAGDVAQQANGNYTIYKPLDKTTIRLQGTPDSNNGRDVTNINVDP